MAMDLNELDYFDDEVDIDSPSQSDDVSKRSDLQDPDQPTYYEFEDDDDVEDSSDEDILTTFLKSKGVNPDSVKFQNEEGDIEEVSFDSLSKEEQLQILGIEEKDDDYGLSDDEINLINQLRSNNLSVNEYNNYIAQQAIQSYLKQSENIPYQVDSISDDELYLIDLKARIPELSDQEAYEELESAKSNTNLYEKKIQSLRDDYKRREQEIVEQEQVERELEAKQQAEAFEKVIVETIDNNDSFNLGDSSLELTVDDKNEIASFILDSDVAGVRYIAKALNDPKTLVKMAWYALKGDEAFEQISDYYKQEIAKAAKTNYQKGYEDAASGKKAAKSIVRKPSSKKMQKDIYTINDIDI